MLHSLPHKRLTATNQPLLVLAASQYVHPIPTAAPVAMAVAAAAAVVAVVEQL
jgi:hypothetical protein